MYDPSLGRFHTLDPMSVFTPGISPYTYADDNPVNYIDYYGLGKREREERRRQRAQNKRERQTNRQNRQRARNNRRNAWDYSRGNKYDPNLHTVAPHEPGQRWNPPRLPKDKLADVSVDIPDVEFDFEDVDISFTPFKPSISIPSKGDNTIFTKTINYKFRSNEFYDLPATEKTLSDLVKTLKDYPQLELRIIGNVYGDDKDLNTPAMLNGKEVTTGDLMKSRADAVLEYLEGKGISRSRMQSWKGNVYQDANRGKSASFILINP